MAGCWGGPSGGRRTGCPCCCVRERARAGGWGSVQVPWEHSGCGSSLWTARGSVPPASSNRLRATRPAPRHSLQASVRRRCGAYCGPGRPLVRRTGHQPLARQRSTARHPYTPCSSPCRTRSRRRTAVDTRRADPHLAPGEGRRRPLAGRTSMAAELLYGRLAHKGENARPPRNVGGPSGPPLGGIRRRPGTAAPPAA